MNQLKKRMMSLAAATAVAGGLGLAAAPGAQAATSSSVWDAVAACESSNDWSINTGNGFYGGLQFSQSTWNEFGGTAYASRADLATKAEQIAIAQKVLAVQGPQAWPVCSGVAGLTTDNGGATSGTPLASTSGSDSTAPDSTASDSTSDATADDSATGAAPDQTSTASEDASASEGTDTAGTDGTGTRGTASARASEQGRTQSGHASDRAKQRAAQRSAAADSADADSSDRAQGQQPSSGHRSGSCADAR